MTSHRSNVKYDDWGWHVGGTFPPDQPDINGFTHIGMYLVWILKHDFGNEELHDRATINRVKAGEISAHDFSDETDGKLVSESMSPRGAAFSDWYYGTEDAQYLGDWAATFSEQPAYTVQDTSENYERIEAVIDKRFHEWEQAGRP